eukprot:7238924-Alexandrium_andersonii.AAC.1
MSVSLASAWQPWRTPPKCSAQGLSCIVDWCLNRRPKCSAQGLRRCAARRPPQLRRRADWCLGRRPKCSAQVYGGAPPATFPQLRR